MVKRFRTLENLENATFEELCSVDGIGDILANNVFQYFRDSNNVDFVNRLLASGVEIDEKKRNKGCFRA